MRKALASFLTILGIISLLISLMSAYYAITSFIDKSKYGRSLMFADIEIFSAITIFFVMAGAFSLWISYRFKKNTPPEDNNKSKLKSKN